MIGKFIIDLSGAVDIEKYNYDSIIKQTTSNSIIKKLDDYLLNNGSLDAAAIEDDWFPRVDAKVFLSHSHRDEKMVKNFAAYLYKKYKIKSFIDSTVWGYADNLLDKLNSECNKEKENENIASIQNKNASFVYLMLQSALAKMIDHCECFIFVNTGNSIVCDNKDRSSTQSIWVANELLTASLIRKKKLSESRRDELRHSDVDFLIPATTSGLVELSISDFEYAKQKSLFMDDPNNILETLYKYKGVLVEKSANNLISNN